MVLWSSKKQRIVSILTTKTEYIAIDYEARKGMWIKRFIKKLQLKIMRLSLKSDIKASLNLTKKSKSQYQTKYIDVQHYYI